MDADRADPAGLGKAQRPGLEQRTGAEGKREGRGGREGEGGLSVVADGGQDDLLRRSLHVRSTAGGVNLKTRGNRR